MIKKIYNLIKAFLGIKPKKMEDPIKIQGKIAELNQLSTDPGRPIVNEWVAFAGYAAITQAFVSKGQTPQFNPTAGITVKAFINWRTGEIKMFNALMFET